MEICGKKYGKPKATPKVIKQLDGFCELLCGNKVKDGKLAFAKLPLAVQCLFLHHSWHILSHKAKYSNDSYLTAFRMFKLFRSKELKSMPIYQKYLKLATVEANYKKALDWNKKSDSIIRNTTGKTTGKAVTGAPKVSKKYKKEYQKFAEPPGVVDSLYIYYTSMYEQIPKSRLSITWLTEHGVYDGDKRTKLIKQYEKLVERGQLIK